MGKNLSDVASDEPRNFRHLIFPGTSLSSPLCMGYGGGKLYFIMSNRNSNRNQRNKRNRRGKGRGGRTTGRGRLHVPRTTNVLTGVTVSTTMRTRKHVVRIPRNMFMAESVVVDLTYPDTTLSRTNNAFTYLSWRYRMNSIFDPDPLLGSGSVPGTTAWGTFFSTYRVLAISYSIDLCNLESSPVDVFACPTINDLGANYVNANELFGNPLCSQKVLSVSGGMDRTRLAGYIDLGELYGNPQQYLGNDGFGSSFGSNPGAIMYINFGGVSAFAFTNAKGLDYRLTITYTTLMHNRKVQFN